MELSGADGRRLKAVSHADGVLDGEVADFTPEGDVALLQRLRRGAKIETAPGPAAANSTAQESEEDEAALVAALRASFFDRI